MLAITSADIPELLNRYIKSEVEEGRYQSKAEAIRDMNRKEMERKHAVDEPVSAETLKAVETARERGDVEGDVRELIEDYL